MRETTEETNTTEHDPCNSERESERESAREMDAVGDQIDGARAELARSETRFDELETELTALLTQRGEYAALQHAVLAVQQLQEAGLAERFWGDVSEADNRVRLVVADIEAYNQQIAAIEAQRSQVLATVDGHHDSLDLLADEMFQLQQAEESKLYEWVVERDETPRARIAQIMPWTRGTDDDQRFRQSMLRSLAAAVVLGLIIPLIDLPMLDRDEVVEVPKRFAQLIERPKTPPPPPAQPIPTEPKSWHS